jgi:hypothetical protein
MLTTVQGRYSVLADPKARRLLKASGAAPAGLSSAYVVDFKPSGDQKLASPDFHIKERYSGEIVAIVVRHTVVMDTMILEVRMVGTAGFSTRAMFATKNCWRPLPGFVVCLYT